jgi:predicted branched-subunit amino acid permease
MFVGLVVLQLTDRIQLAVAAASAVLCGAFSTFMGGTWNIIAAAMAGATMGLFLEVMFDRRGKDSVIGSAAASSKFQDPGSKSTDESEM